MPVFSVWESHFPLEASEAGREVTEAIWRRDMPGFNGYVSHELIEDLDDPGTLARRQPGGPRASARMLRCASTPARMCAV